jgi:hypothetical protein
MDTVLLHDRDAVLVAETASAGRSALFDLQLQLRFEIGAKNGIPRDHPQKWGEGQTYIATFVTEFVSR